MIVVLVLTVVCFSAWIKVRRFRLTGQALRADRQPRSEWSGRYPRNPISRRRSLR